MSISTDPHGPPRLVLRFAVYAGAAVLLAVIGALLLSRFNASESAESDLADDAAYVADELGRDDLVRVAFAGRVTDDIQAQLDDFVGPIAGARDLTRASLVSPSGTITYSTDHALRGKPASALGNGTLDASSPVQWVLETGRTRGRFVAERNDAVIAAEVRRAFLTQSALVVLALLLLYGALDPRLPQGHRRARSPEPTARRERGPLPHADGAGLRRDLRRRPQGPPDRGERARDRAARLHARRAPAAPRDGPHEHRGRLAAAAAHGRPGGGQDDPRGASRSPQGRHVPHGRRLGEDPRGRPADDEHPRRLRAQAASRGAEARGRRPFCLRHRRRLLRAGGHDHPPRRQPCRPARRATPTSTRSARGSQRRAP